MTCLLNHVVLLVVQLVLVVLAQEPRNEDPVVSTTLGRIQGTRMDSFSGKTIYAFRGIPYAEPPIRDLRFEPPKPIHSWADTVLMATSDSLVCPQTGITLLMSEDCLKLNVFTKNLTGKQPVIVYIHGGANVLGSGHSSYEAGPQYLLEHDVVLVAFNYRLGALGFLTGGNYGYLDQIMALEWVQAHIANFGGDPDLVTIMGMSAGSMAVSLHLVSPLSKGLFHRAILMSGSATNHYSIHNEFWTRLLARQVACPMYNAFDMTECLRNVTWKRIIEVCSQWEQYKFVNMKWNYETDNYFLPMPPSVLINKGEFNKVPLLVSFTANELDYTTLAQMDNDLLLHDIYENFDEYAPEFFLFDYNPLKSRRIKEFYFGQKQELSADNIEKFGNIFSDSIIGHGVHRLVDLARKHTKVYYSRMDYVGQRSLSAPLKEDKSPVGVGHADDLQYVMSGLWYGTLLDKNHKDVFMMERLTEWYTHFAKNGYPMPDEKSWTPCNSTSIKMLYNDRTIKMGPPAYVSRYAVWDQLFPKPTGKGTAIVASRYLLVLALALAMFSRGLL
ncbi:esterase E4 [Drosophila innubila]|uniref:esterase E4 n=1 Tax=Drosophila innubila TaxID=198719 RepID=UPI00148B6EB7|nr:esterase E4 [Drosophila innubila]